MPVCHERAYRGRNDSKAYHLRVSGFARLRIEPLATRNLELCMQLIKELA